MVIKDLKTPAVAAGMVPGLGPPIVGCCFCQASSCRYVAIIAAHKPVWLWTEVTNRKTSATGMDIMRVKRLYLSLTAIPLAVGLLIGSGIAGADENWSDRLSFSGFSSANYHITDDGAPYNGEKGIGHDSKGSFQGTRAGLNFRADIAERLSFAGQFFASKNDDFNVELEWGFGSLQLTDNLSARAGKIKYPAGLVNEYVNVGYAYPWITAPAVIYSELGAPNGPQITRESYTGIGLLGNRNSGDWTFGSNLFSGEVEEERFADESLLVKDGVFRQGEPTQGRG